MVELSLFLLVIGAGIIGVTYKVVLPKLIDIRINKLIHSQNKEIKRLEKHLEMLSIGFSKSMDVASQIEESFRKERIKATSIFWNEFLRIKYEFSSLVELISILTDEELNSVTKENIPQNEKVLAILKEYSTIESITVKIEGSEQKIPIESEVVFLKGPSTLKGDQTRIFVSNKLWKIYECLVIVNYRIGFLVSTGMKCGKIKSWKNDPLIKNAIVSIFFEEEWVKITNREFGALKILVNSLELEFIQEAVRNLRNLEEFEETLARINSISTEGEEQLRQLRNEYLTSN